MLFMKNFKISRLFEASKILEVEYVSIEFPPWRNVSNLMYQVL